MRIVITITNALTAMTGTNVSIRKWIKTTLHGAQCTFKHTIVVAATLLCTLLPSVAHAGGDLASSELGKGLKKLIDDLTSYLMWIGPSVAVVVVIYCFIRKAASDEMEHRKWNQRIVSTIICGVAILAASLLFKLFFGYFGLEAPA